MNLIYLGNKFIPLSATAFNTDNSQHLSSTSFLSETLSFKSLY